MAARMTKRGGNRYAATVTHEGKRIFFYGRTQSEAKAKAQEARDRLKAGSPVKDATRTLAEWLTEWCQTFLVASTRSAKTREMHEGFVRVWIVPHHRHGGSGPAQARRRGATDESDDRRRSVRQHTP